MPFRTPREKQIKKPVRLCFKRVRMLREMENPIKLTVVVFSFFMAISIAEPGETQEECQVTRCKRHGPEIRFPFWLKGRQPEHCGYSGFELSCDENKHTVLELPRCVNLSVKHIDYVQQRLLVDDSKTCLPKLLMNLTLSTTPFSFYSTENVTLFNCSSNHFPSYRRLTSIPCLSIPGYIVQAYEYASIVLDQPLLSCRKIYNGSIPFDVIYPGDDLWLRWIYPKCSICETQDRRCGLKRNVTGGQIDCFDIPGHLAGRSKKQIVTGTILGSVFLAVFITGGYCACRGKMKQEESRVKIRRFLMDYKALKPTRYSYADVKRITNQFKERLGKGGYGTVFKGRLSNDVLVAIKVLDEFKGNGEEFINEVGSMGRIHHVNVARLVGFCADGSKRALVYEYLPNESLEKFIFPTKGKNRSLSWEKLQDIALGVAKGIEYLHHGCDQQILHFDIKPHNILLDNDFNPKISDFGLAKLCSKEKSAVSMTAARGTIGYIAPEVLSRNFGNVSDKSDVYSYGMLLLDIVGGRKNIDVPVENISQVYFPEWVYNRLNQGEESTSGISIEEESHAKIEKKLTIVGLWCIRWYPGDRPSMKAVVQMLLGETESLTIPPNPFALTAGKKMNTTIAISRGHVGRELEIISELN